MALGCKLCFNINSRSDDDFSGSPAGGKASVTRKPKSRTGSGLLRERAYEEIKRRILDATFAPGTLLSENQLAEDLQISRTPIREALRDLSSGGLVKILPQRGVAVTELSLQDVIEVYQLREQLECFAVRLAAPRIGPDDVSEFKADHQRALDSMRGRRLRQAYDHSVLLHSRIIAMARNSRLTQFMQLLGDQVHRFGLMTLRNGRVEQALLEHGHIVDALVASRAEEAEELMRLHLRADRDMVVRLILPAGIGAADLEPPLPKPGLAA
jgi:DNA-binding GntR family transcriptional regulator